jgi:hypothetical protein
VKLFEAITEGAKLRPQAFGMYFTGNTRSDACSCVIGSVYEVTFPDCSLSHDAVVNQFENLAKHYPLLRSEEKHFCLECAGDKSFQDNLTNLLIHLNDEHKWTREQIAEFVRRFE